MARWVRHVHHLSVSSDWTRPINWAEEAECADPHHSKPFWDALQSRGATTDPLLTLHLGLQNVVLHPTIGVHLERLSFGHRSCLRDHDCLAAKRASRPHRRLDCLPPCRELLLNAENREDHYVMVNVLPVLAGFQRLTHLYVPLRVLLLYVTKDLRALLHGLRGLERLSLFMGKQTSKWSAFVRDRLLPTTVRWVELVAMEGGVDEQRRVRWELRMVFSENDLVVTFRDQPWGDGTTPDGE
jgi:hypothetical protein